jgi:Icc-related predicted phosphoesterase
MTKVLAVGDLHGRLDMLSGLVDRNPDIDFVLQAGDFGVYCDNGACCGIPPSRRYHSEFWSYFSGEKHFAKPVFFVKGNHEHFKLLDGATSRSPASEPVPLAQNLFHIPNGRVVMVMGIVIAGLGGNYSPSCYRKPKGGLRRRHFSEGEVASILGNKYKVDVLLTHDVGEGMIPGFRNLSQELLDLGRRLRPTWWIHGHFHCHHEADLGFTRVVGLDAIHGREISSRIIDIEPMER